MRIINSVFFEGFWNGLASPIRLFGDSPKPEIQPIKIDKLYRPTKSIKEAMHKDMAMIAEDFKVVLGGNGVKW